MYETYLKRTLDIIIAAVVLVVFAVPILILIPFVRRDTDGSAIMKQPRFGKNRQPFTLYKIRTMHVSAPSDKSTSTFTNSGVYISKFGKVLRKLSIDEIPQAFNVLKGDMSIVGPRPVILKEEALIELREQVGANSVRPGITGWAQVNGRDELSDAIKSRMDGEYVRDLSFAMDVKCIAYTFAAVLSLKGHKEGHELDDESVLDSGLVVDEE